MAEKAKCRVCGAEFNPCKGVSGIPPENQPFNWRKICCSITCGQQFITSVLESRGLTSQGTPVEATAPEVVVPEDDVSKAVTPEIAAAESPEPEPKPRRQRKPVQQAVEPEEATGITEPVMDGAE